MSDYALTMAIVPYPPEDDSYQSNDNLFLKISSLEQSPLGSNSVGIFARANA